MNVQPKPAIPAIDHAPVSCKEADPLSRGRVPAAGPRLVFTWPVEFEVEPWRP